jgi:hypothetical protein
MASVPDNVGRATIKRSERRGKLHRVREARKEHRSTFFFLSWMSLHQMKTSLLKF